MDINVVKHSTEVANILLGSVLMHAEFHMECSCNIRYWLPVFPIFASLRLTLSQYQITIGNNLHHTKNLVAILYKGDLDSHVDGGFERFTSPVPV